MCQQEGQNPLTCITHFIFYVFLDEYQLCLFSAMVVREEKGNYIGLKGFQLGEQYEDQRIWKCCEKADCSFYYTEC